MKKYNFFFFSLYILSSFSSIGWETKNEFDRDLKVSVESFLKKRDQTHVLFKDVKDFVETHEHFLKEYSKFCVYDPTNPNRPWFGVMKEIKSLSETGIDLFETFFCVGPRKALSNLPTHTYIVDEEIKSTIEKWASDMGYKTYIDAAPGKWGALWVFDPHALQNLLSMNSSLLKEYEVSQDPIEFIKKIDKVDERGLTLFDLTSGNTRMFQLIARAFGREMSLGEIENLMKSIRLSP